MGTLSGKIPALMAGTGIFLGCRPASFQCKACCCLLSSEQILTQGDRCSLT